MDFTFINAPININLNLNTNLSKLINKSPKESIRNNNPAFPFTDLKRE